MLTALGARIRALRTERGLSVTELALQAGLSRRHATDAEAGRANLTVASLVRLAQTLGVNPAELLAARSTKRRVALLGLRGAGKSSVGRELALELEAPFVELDQRIEALSGLGLAAIFDLYGVAGYRRLEARALEQVLGEGESLVLATGGSIVGSRVSYERLLATCRTVWLAASPLEHFQRVEAQGDRRPMAGRPRAMQELEALLEERAPLYARCEKRVDTDGSAPREVAREIARWLEGPSSTGGEG